MSHKAKGKIPVLSFFTGAGFLDIGFMKAGFDVVFHNEFSPEFAEGFKHGYCTLTGSETPPKVTVGDITALKADEILEAAFGKKGPPKVWGVVGGPPCPDFSIGGKNRGHEGDHGKLSQTFIDKIMALKPTFFLFENVPGLFRTEKHRRFLNELRRQAEEELYTTDIKILNALEFGVPQDRERVFFIGIRKDWLEAHGKAPSVRLYNPITFEGHWFPYPAPLVKNIKKLYAWPGKDPFGGNPEPPIVPEELTVGYWLLDEKIDGLPNQDEHFKAYSEKFHVVEEGDDRKKSFKRLHRYRYAPTSAYGNNEVHLHPTLPRRLTVREALRLQSVPDQYALPTGMSLSDKFKTIGNGVPVRLAQFVAAAIRQFLLE